MGQSKREKEKYLWRERSENLSIRVGEIAALGMGCGRRGGEIWVLCCVRSEGVKIGKFSARAEGKCHSILLERKSRRRRRSKAKNVLFEKGCCKAKLKCQYVGSTLCSELQRNPFFFSFRRRHRCPKLWALNPFTRCEKTYLVYMQKMFQKHFGNTFKGDQTVSCLTSHAWIAQCKHDLGLRLPFTLFVCFALVWCIFSEASVLGINSSFFQHPAAKTIRQNLLLSSFRIFRKLVLAPFSHILSSSSSFWWHAVTSTFLPLRHLAAFKWASLYGRYSGARWIRNPQSILKHIELNIVLPKSELWKFVMVLRSPFYETPSFFSLLFNSLLQ